MKIGILIKDFEILGDWDLRIINKIIVAQTNFDKGLISMHHLNQSNDIFVTDAAYRKK